MTTHTAAGNTGQVSASDVWHVVKGTDSDHGHEPRNVQYYIRRSGHNRLPPGWGGVFFIVESETVQVTSQKSTKCQGGKQERWGGSPGSAITPPCIEGGRWRSWCTESQDQHLGQIAGQWKEANKGIMGGGLCSAVRLWLYPCTEGRQDRETATCPVWYPASPNYLRWDSLTDPYSQCRIPSNPRRWGKAYLVLVRIQRFILRTGSPL